MNVYSQDSSAGTVELRQKVQVWIYCDPGKGDGHWVLILRTSEARGDFWQPVTGSVEPGESLDAAALREAVEETGLSFRGAPIAIGQPFRFKGGSGEMFEEFGFAIAVCRGSDGEPPQVRIDPKEHQESRWVSPEEAVRMVRFPSNSAMLQDLLQRHGGKS
jgi:8-oxo-dGTP pyrophosphatase MutT (NUDIX family)